VQLEPQSDNLTLAAHRAERRNGGERLHSSIVPDSFRLVKMTEPLAYLNGRISPASQLSLSVADLGVVMGASVTSSGCSAR
jgi:hypothetical protein